MKQVNATLWVASQPDAGTLDQARDEGIVRIINNRVPGEEPGQPDPAQAEADAKARGMDFVPIPVKGGQIEEASVRRFQEAIRTADGPVLAHCKSGQRSLTLFAIGEVLDGRADDADLDALAQRTGIDLSGAKTWLRNKGH